MSLINDMLQDLDSRKQLQNTESISSEIVAAPPIDSGRHRNVWIFLGVVLAAFIGFWLVQSLVTGLGDVKPVLAYPATDKDTAADVSTKEIPVAAGGGVSMPHTEILQQDIDDQPVEMTTANTVEGGTDKYQLQIKPLLSMAEAALNQNRLSLPRGKSAYDLYRRVIAIEADNIEALAGLDKIKNRYADLIEDALVAAEFEQAAQLVRRVENLSLTFNVSQLDGYRERIHEQRYAAEKRVTKESEPELLAADNQLRDDAYLAINKTTVSRELALARKAQQLFVQGRGGDAVKQLENFIANNSKADLSRIWLFDYYLNQSQISQAREVMEPEHTMDAATLAYMQARLTLMSSGTASAVALLEKQKPKKNIVEAYNKLLAGLYQKEKSHGKAVALYASLIEINPSNVTYWLGLGISRDALGELQSARNAYNVVLAHKNLDRNVRNFVETRIQALSSQELAEVAW